MPRRTRYVLAACVAILPSVLVVIVSHLAATRLIWPGVLLCAATSLPAAIRILLEEP